MMDSVLIEQIKSFCFRTDSRTARLPHDALLNRIENSLVSSGWRVYRESPLSFETIARRNGQEKLRSGFLDILATRDGFKLGIEVDTGTHLKFKSIEKLFQSEASVCIGIVGGNKRNPLLLDENTKRILECRKRFEFHERSFWLIIVLQMISKKVLSSSLQDFFLRESLKGGS